jgi:hypothetical protein
MSAFVRPYSLPPTFWGRLNFLSTETEKVHDLVLRSNASWMALLLTVLCLMGGCATNGSNSEVSRADSPDGHYTAVAFVRNVDATTDFSTQVSILRYGARLGNGGGDIFTCDSDHGRADELKDHSYWMKLTWSSPTALLIQYNQRVRVFKKIDKYKSISISYDPIEVSSTK